MFLYDVLIQFSELFLSIVSLFLMCLIVTAAAMLSQVMARFLHWVQTHDLGRAFNKQALTPEHE